MFLEGLFYQYRFLLRIAFNYLGAQEFDSFLFNFYLLENNFPKKNPPKTLKNILMKNSTQVTILFYLIFFLIKNVAERKPTPSASISYFNSSSDAYV